MWVNILLSITIVYGFYWLYKYISDKRKPDKSIEDKNKEIEGSVKSIENVLRNSFKSGSIRDNIFDKFSEELENNLDFVKGRYPGGKKEAQQAGDLFLKDLQSLCDLMSGLKATESFTRGQKLSIARAIVRSFALSVMNDSIRMAKIADPEDDRSANASMVENGKADKDVLDALTGYFSNVSDVTPAEIVSLADRSNSIAVKLEEYENYGVKEYDDLFAEEAFSGRFGPDDITEIAKQIQLFHVLNLYDVISENVLKQLGVAEGLDEILAQAMSKIKFRVINPPDFKNMFGSREQWQKDDYIPTLLSKLTDSGYSYAIFIAEAIKILDLKAQDLGNIITSLNVSPGQSKMFFALKYILFDELNRKVY
jgi:hypothetical protein